MKLTAEDILYLSRSGYNMAQIDAIGNNLAQVKEPAVPVAPADPAASAPAEPEPAASAPAEPEPAPNKQPVPPHPSSPEKAAASAAAGADPGTSAPVIQGILDELRALKTSMQRGNLLAAEQPPRPEDSADNILRGFVIPPTKKGD